VQVVANSVGFNSDGLTVIVVVAWGPLVGISPSAMLRGGPSVHSRPHRATRECRGDGHRGQRS
jgi:hypothetical protein